MAEGGVPSRRVRRVEDSPICVFRKDDFDWNNKKLLGRGGYGEVNLVHQISRRRNVVVKVPTNYTVLSQEIKKEVEVLRRIHMEYIVEVYGLVVNDDLVCGFAMEHVALGSVDDVVQKAGHKLPWSLQLRVIHQTAKAMQHLHANMILHLDLKTQNILMDDECNVKITDFGLSKIRQFVSTSQNVQDRLNGGTRYFIPPEVLSEPECKSSRKMDVYAFAITMWQILTGARMPFPNIRDPYLLKEDIIRGRRPSLEQTRQSTRQERQIREIMIRCWDNVPEQRPHFTEIVPALTALSDEVLNRALMDADQLKAELNSRGPALHVRASPLLHNPLPEMLNLQLEAALHEAAPHAAAPHEAAPHEAAPHEAALPVRASYPCVSAACHEETTAARHPLPDRGIPVQTSDHSAAFAEYDLKVQQGRKMAATLSEHTRQQIIDAAETIPQPDSMVVRVAPNHSTRVTQDESTSFAREVFQRFGRPKGMAMVKQVFRDAGIPVRSVRFGCMEFIFEDPLSADDAQTLISSLPRIQDWLTELLLGEGKDKYHLEVSIADEVRKLASTSKQTRVTMATTSIHLVLGKLLDCEVIFGDSGEVVVSYKASYSGDCHFFHIYHHDGKGKVMLVGAIGQGQNLPPFSSKQFISGGSLYTRDIHGINKYSLKDLRMVKRIHLERTMDVIGVMDSNTIMTRRPNDVHSSLILLNEDGRIVLEIPTAPSDGSPFSTCEVGDYIIVLYHNRTDTRLTLKGFKKLGLDVDFTIVTSSQLFILDETCISAYGSSHVLVRNGNNTIAIYQIPSGKCLKEIRLDEDLKIGHLPPCGIRYYHEHDDHGILYVADDVGVRSLSLHVYKVSDYLGSPSFEQLAEKKLLHEDHKEEEQEEYARVSSKASAGGHWERTT